MPSVHQRYIQAHGVLVFLSFILCLTYSGMGADYYVTSTGDDNNPGTEAQPWKTIQKAADVVEAGSNVYVKVGTYFEKISINVSGSVSEGYITFSNYGSDEVIIDGTGVSNNPASYTDDIIYMENKDYIRIIGFKICHVNTNEGSGIRAWGRGSHIEIRNNEIYEIRGGGSNGGAMGITIYGSDDNQSINNIIIDNNHIHDCDPAHSEALTLNGNVEQFEVTNNVIHDVNNIGIDFISGENWISTKYARNGICTGNKVYRARSSYGGGWAAGIYVDGGSEITVEDNEVYQCDLGIEIGAENSAVTTIDVTVRDNYVHDNDKAGIVYGGYGPNRGRVQYCEFLGNTLEHNDTLGEGLGEFWVQWASDNVVTDNTIRPNAQNIALFNEHGINETYDFNDYCNVGGTGAEDLEYTWHNNNYLGLTSFKSGTGQEAGSAVCGSSETPVIDELKRKRREPGQKFNIIGRNFGTGEPSDFVKIGSKKIYFGTKPIKEWTPTKIKVKISKKKYVKDSCAWFKGLDKRKVKILVNVGGIDSNNKRLTLIKNSANCQ